MDGVQAVDEWQPTWGLREDEALSLNQTLDIDAASQTRAIRAKAETPAQINEQFDGIAYGKAGAVIGMVEHYIGPDVFQRGVHNYMEAHKFGNATAEDFWGAQTKASGKPVDKIMESFVAQPGEPLLRFTADNGGYTVQQSRFFLTPSAATPAAQQWTVPVCVRGGACQVVMGAGNVSVTSAGAFANADAKGYYRSSYDDASLHTLLGGATTLKAPERISLVGDRYALLRSGQGTVSSYLDLVAALRNDPNAEVLQQSLSGLGSIRQRVATDAQAGEIKAWVRAEFGPVYAAMGPATSGESLEKAQRRDLLLGLLGAADDPAAVAEAKNMAQRYMGGDTSMDPELAQTAVGIAAGHGDASLYDALQHVAETSTDPNIQTKALFTLASFQNPALVKRTLDYVASGKVRNQDSWILLSILLQQRETRPQTWSYIKANWDKVHAQFTTSSGNRVVSATGAFCSVEDRADVQQFFASHLVDAADRALRDALNNIDSCVKFRAQQQPNLQQWLATTAH